jgi:hypothetical protein
MSVSERPRVPDLEILEQYERLLDKLEKNQRDIENHWKKLLRRVIEYEENKQERPPPESSGPPSQEAAAQ